MERSIICGELSIMKGKWSRATSPKRYAQLHKIGAEAAWIDRGNHNKRFAFIQSLLLGYELARNRKLAAEPTIGQKILIHPSVDVKE